MKLIDKDALVAEIERLKKEVGDDEYWNGYDIALDEVLYFIDTLEVKKSAEIQHKEETCKENGNSLTHEPVNNVWHDMSEDAENGRNTIIIDPKDFYGAVLRKGGSQLKNHNKERYIAWAYIDDIINITNKEEPVSEGLEKAAVEAFKQIVDSDKNNFLEIFKAGAKWQKKRDFIPLSDDINEVARQICNKVLNCEIDYKEDDVVLSDEEECVKAGIRWQMHKESIPSKDLEELINSLSKQFPEVSFAKLSRIAVRVAKWQKEKEYTCYEEAFEDGAKWKVENLWKPADGDDLPEYEREVIVFTQIFPDDTKMMVVAIAHRPKPDGWDGKSIATGEVEHYTPKTYGKGGWNIPNVKYWLDCLLPNMED